METLTVKVFDRETLIQVYETLAVVDFPKSELKPLGIILNAYDLGQYEGLGLYRGSELTAYALYVKYQDQNSLLLDYYAVLADYRMHGLGSVFLEKMQDYYKDWDGILIETENPAMAEDEAQRRIRERRNHFYQENGGQLTQIASQIYGVDYQIFYLPIKAEKPEERICQELIAIYERLCQGLEGVYQVRFPVHF